MSERLEEIIYKEKPDILFYNPNKDIEGILPESLKSITGSKDTQTIIWMNHLSALSSEEVSLLSSCANYIITPSKESFRNFQEARLGCKIIKSQWAFNTFNYPAKASLKNREISFIGATGGGRSYIIDKMRQSGLSVDVFGQGWQESSYVSFYDMMNIFNQSKINVDLCYDASIRAGQIARRVFEITGCRGFLITHPADSLEEYYEPGKEVVSASSLEELIDKCRYYLTHEHERETIARQGYERTIKEHTWSRRFMDIFRHIGFTAIPRPIPMNGGAPHFVESSQTTPLSASAMENKLATSIDSENEVIETTINVMAYNQLEYTKKCVESILHYTKGPYELLLTDNGSTDGTSEYFTDVKNFHPHTRVIKNFCNRIAETAVNHSTCAARGKYYVFVSNDTVVHEGWLENLIRHLESAPDIGWVGPRSNSISGPQLEPAGYDTLETFQTFAAERANRHQGENFPVERLAGMLVITKKQYFERIGGADPYLPANGRDGGYGFSDDDISLRFLIAGYKLLVANDVYIHHFGSVSARQHRPDLFGTPQNLNKEKYIRKIRENSRITIAQDGKMIIKPYRLDDIIPVEERMVIRTPRICFAETEDNITKATETESIYADVAQKHNGQIFGSSGKTIQSMIMQILDDNSYDFLVLIDSRIAPLPESISALTEAALCYPDVGIMVPTGNYAPATHRQAKTEKGIELIDYAELSTCAVNLKIIRPFRLSLANCENDDELLWFLQRRLRGEGYFIAKANNIEVNCGRPILAHPFDTRALPEQLLKEKKYAEAAVIYRNDLEKDPTFAEAHYQLARIAREQRRTEEAISQAELALHADPHHIDSLIFLSDLLMLQNNWKRAESFIRQANFKQPGNQAVQKIVEQYEKIMGKKVIASQQEDSTIPYLTNREFIKDRTSIIVTASSNHIRECITAIKKHTPEPYELIVIDNFKSADLKKKLQKTVKEISGLYKILEHSPKSPILQSVNLCINNSTGEYIVLLMDDTIVSDGWLTGMLTCLKFAPDAGIIGPMTNTGSDLQRVNDDLCQSVNYLDKYAAKFQERFRHRRVPCRNINVSCLLFKRTFADKIGLLDERFNAGQFEVEDYCWRAALDGFKNYIAGDVFIYSYGNKELQSDRTIIDTKWTLSMDSLEGKKLVVLKSRELADVMYQKGLMDQAVEALINCIKLTPDAKEIYYDLTRMFIESKRFPEAGEVLGTMPEAVKNDVKGLEYAGYAMEGLGRDDEAAAYADRMLSQNEKYPAALNLRGILAYKRGDKEKAADYFQKAIAADPGHGEAHINLGVLYWGSQQKEAALAHLKKGFILSPFIPDVNSIYYSVMSSVGMFGEAEEDFCEALKLYPCNKNLVFLCIDIFLQQSKYDAALYKIEDTLDVFGLDDGLLNAAIDIREKTGPLQIDKANKKGTLSLCMIVKNEEKYLVPCLKSVRDIVDEIIIVDTGSTDKTVAIARIFGAKLFEFPWTGDFSAARNHSLEQATGHWIFVLDGDEVISPLDYKKIKQIISRKSPSLCAYSIATRNYLSTVGGIGWVKNSGEYPEESGAGRVESVKVRLFTRNKNVFFINPVHELLEYSLKKEKIPILPCNVIVHHYGKLDIQKDQQKGEDYYLLGKVKYENDPTNMKYILELAKQAHLLNKNEEAAELFQKLLSLIETNPDSPSFAEIYQMTHGKPLLEIYTTLAAVYLALDRFDEALNVARKSIDNSKKLEANIFVYAHCEIIAGSLANAFRELEKSLQTSPDYPPNLIMMAAVFCLEGKKEKTREYILLLQQKRVVITTLFNTIAEELMMYGKKDDALLILNAMIENKINDQETMRLMEELRK